MSLSKQLCNVSKSMNFKFFLNDKPISAEEVFSVTGMLPAVARRADRLCALCLGYGIGVSFDQDERSILGIKVNFDDITPDMLRHVFILDVMVELAKMSPDPDQVPLDELLYDNP